MNACGLLAGRNIVVTRPLAQAEPLAAMIAAQGGRPFIFPLLEIGPAPDRTGLDQALAGEHGLMLSSIYGQRRPGA